MYYKAESMDWYTGGNCWPAGHAELSFDVTCCQEGETSKAVCVQSELFVLLHKVTGKYTVAGC